LSGNYLKSLQLAKQLEQRAKEATQNKRLAEEERDALQKFIDLCEESDVDLGGVDKLLSEFSASINAKDYQSAIGHARKAMESARNAYIQKVADVGDSVDAILKLIKDPEAESKGALEMLEKSKDLVMKDDLQGAMKQARSAYDAAERTFHEYFSLRFSQAQEAINQAKDMDEDVSLFEDLLNRSKAALEKQDYESGISQLTEALEGAGENIKGQIEEGISKADDISRAGQDIGADMERVTSHIERARAALEGLRYRDALSYSKRAESEAEKAISSRLTDQIRDIRDGIKSMKTVDEDSKETRDLLDKAQEAIREKDYSEAISSFKDANKKIRDIHFQAVLGVIAKAKDKFVLAKKVGVDMSKAIELLNKSRASLRKDEFEKAIRLAEESEDAVGTALQLFYRARDELVELTKVIKLMKSLGQDIQGVKLHLDEAKKAFENRDYEKSSKALSEGISTGRNKIHEIVVSKTDMADGAIKLGKSIGAELAEAEMVFQKAAESMTGEDLAMSIKLAEESLDAANSAITSALNTRLRSLEEFIDGFEKKDDSMNGVRDQIAMARKHVEAGEFEETNEIISGVTTSLENVGREECERLMTMVREKLDVAESIGVDTKTIEESLSEIDGLLESKSYDDAMAKIKGAMDGADQASFRSLQAEFSSIKDTMEEAKALEMDVSDIKDRLTEARTKAESQYYRESYDLTVAIKSAISDRVSKHDAIKEKIRRAEGLIQEAAKSKADVSGLDGSLKEAIGIFEEGRFDEAEGKLDTLIDETEKRLAMYLAAKLILASKESLELSVSHGIDVEEAQDLLSKAKDEMKDKNYDVALELSKKSSEMATAALAIGVDEQIKDVRRIVAEAKNVSMDTVGPDKLVDKAVELAKEGDYTGALKCVDSAREDVDHVRNLNAQATAEIKSARAGLKEAEMLNMDIGKPREMLEQAVEALTRHQYAIAIELAKKSSETSVEIAKTSVWKTLEEFKDRIDRASEEGVYVGTAERCVAEGIEAYNDKRYHEALNLAMKCETEMERAELQRDISSKAVENARKKISDAKLDGITAESAIELVEKAEQLLAKGRYTDALAAAIESGDALHEVRERFDGARIEFSAVREQIERLKKVDIDSSECDEMLDIAQNQLTSLDFEKFMETLVKCSTMVSELFVSSINELMDESKTRVTMAKSLGINTKACEDLLEVAGTSLSERLWDFAYKQARECGAKCTELVDKKLNGLILDATMRLETLGHIGAAVKTIRESMDEAKTLSGSGDHVKAFDILMDIDQKIAVIEDSNRKYIDISIAAESAIENLRRLGGQVREVERLVALADLEKEKDYDSAIELVAEALDTAQTELESYAPEITGWIETEGLYQDQEGEVTLVLRNSGKAEARAVTVDLSGEFEVRSVPELQSIGPGGEERISVKIIPKADGELSMSANIRVRRPFDAITDSFGIDSKMKVYPPGEPYKITRATSVTKCRVCQGKIKEGFDVVSCRCGGEHHLTCAKRAKECPVCSQKYQF
jgi:tetratricopeptide (TPR) repeat protein